MARVFNISINPSRLSIDHRALKIPQSFFKNFPESFFRLSYGARRSYIPLTIMATSLQSKFSKSANYFPNTQPAKEVLEIWRSADAVCFDVDSTVCLHEGIDELADFCGAGKAVSEWTTKAMSGSVPFEEALAARLSLFSPSLSQLQCFLDERPPRLSPGIAELINKLKTSNIDVYLISGGFRQMIKPVAVQLEIPLENIFANQLLFGSSGEFLGFDPTEFTSRSGGKAVAVQHIRKVHGYKSLIMIGDGATDLEWCWHKHWQQQWSWNGSRKWREPSRRFRFQCWNRNGNRRHRNRNRWHWNVSNTHWHHARLGISEHYELNKFRSWRSNGR